MPRNVIVCAYTYMHQQMWEIPKNTTGCTYILYASQLRSTSTHIVKHVYGASSLTMANIK